MTTLLKLPSTIILLFFCLFTIMTLSHNNNKVHAAASISSLWNSLFGTGTGADSNNQRKNQGMPLSTGRIVKYSNSEDASESNSNLRTILDKIQEQHQYIYSSGNTLNQQQERNEIMSSGDEGNQNYNRAWGQDKEVPFEYIVELGKELHDDDIKSSRSRFSASSEANSGEDTHTILSKRLRRDLSDAIATNTELHPIHKKRFLRTASHDQEQHEANFNVNLMELVPGSSIYKVKVSMDEDNLERDAATQNTEQDSADAIVHDHLKKLKYLKKVDRHRLMRFSKR